METEQRVVNRNWLFSRLLWVLAAVAVILLAFCLVRENLPDHVARSWPWRLRLLDTGSALTAVLGTGGAALARAQYAQTVRPALSSVGGVYERPPAGGPVWAFQLVNGSPDVAVIKSVAYWIVFSPAAIAAGAASPGRWLSQEEMVAAIKSRQLAKGEDFDFKHLGRGAFISADRMTGIGWLSERAMQQVQDLFVEVRVLDRAGDTHERVMPLMKNIDRPLRHPTPPFLV
ncbi:hypothetical protein OHT57_01035 [Streptomyces sp. NBC_00285]|uniref:hypothetical protein n=1 Tax=Streptomyces sp. NBC_00285 TaxID=2975700 RepID=UPI002E2B0B5C|nr:hypothetical protein [Streptomyces sp. NBC_00285]